MSGFSNLPGGLPAGAVVMNDDGVPALWASVGPASLEVFTRLHAERTRSGFHPVLLDEPAADWEAESLFESELDRVDDLDAEQVLSSWFEEVEEQSTWPGLAPAQPLRHDPDALALELARELLSADPALRLGLVPVSRGADVLASLGWSGAVNFDASPAELSCVLRSWEERFGVRLVAIDSATVVVSVAAEITETVSLQLAGEHVAFCSDAIYQDGPGSVAEYADELPGQLSWRFWWD
ncbi:DUF4253 domain-containing protein [Kineococcus rhizosphaerae]|uniref:Uncharacterized protein DUF4253 n=1 Tax=Kineococcus rhizosphaerae TaxID=559628 RepID=A0A2T0QZU2_9ACTN|nr:DUF4253 domain-containing protein [Kineococcus rhizosphaerae]PRY12207.1 uncharacterized protein DUF4253 [Kineococcus rhizosphaerae]